MSKAEKRYFQRAAESFEAIIMLLSVNVETVGLSIVRKELSQKPHLTRIYDSTFDRTVRINRDAKSLARAYMLKTSLKAEDALIFALASTGKVDVLLSWNRDDIVNTANLQTVHRINKKRRVRFPIFATPKEFLDRIFMSPAKTICLSHVPIPEQYRLKTFQTR